MADLFRQIAAFYGKNARFPRGLDPLTPNAVKLSRKFFFQQDFA
jgi:hypothetical protein